MVVENLRLVHFTIARLPSAYRDLEPYDDIVSIGTIGLIKACQNIEDDKGKLSTYAIALIAGEIRHHFRKFYFGRSKEQAKRLRWAHLEALSPGRESRAIAYHDKSDLEGQDEVISILKECGLSDLDQDLICLKLFEELTWKEIAAIKQGYAQSLNRRYKKALIKVKKTLNSSAVS